MLSALLQKRHFWGYVIIGVLGIVCVLGYVLYHGRCITIQAIMGAPAGYAHAWVRVHGTVSHVECKISQRDHAYYTFTLTGDPGPDTITVFAFGAPTLPDGETVTVSGRFDQVKKIGPWTITNEIDVTYGTITTRPTLGDKIRTALGWR